MIHKSRNIQLDFFRGLALLIIFVNHVPHNELALFTPSRFGLSDAAEIFVFLSGYAAALAYGDTFRNSGLGLGSVRVFHRCGQIYLAHLGAFLLLAVICLVGNVGTNHRDYIDVLNIRFFFDHTEEALLQLISLRYVPNYFDILPMYLVVMLWIPLFWALSRVHVRLAMLFSVGLYLAMWWFGLELSADARSNRPWFFNPFGWQLIFFTGYACGSGWLESPHPNKWLASVCVVFLVLVLPLGPEPALRPTPSLIALHAELQPLLDKTRFGLLRWLHFMALAYLSGLFLSSREHWLHATAARPIVLMGRQSLPIFVLTLALSYMGGMVFDHLDHTPSSILLVNLGGCLLLLLAARGLVWIKSCPWKAPATNLAPSGNAIACVAPWAPESATSQLGNAATFVLTGVLAVVPIAWSQQAGKTLNPTADPGGYRWTRSGPPENQRPHGIAVLRDRLAWNSEAEWKPRTIPDDAHPFFLHFPTRRCSRQSPAEERARTGVERHKSDHAPSLRDRG